jgi:FkbM family methyltransferase
MTYTKRPSPFVLLASSQGTLIVNKNDYRMIDATRGYGVGWQLFSQGCFDPDEVGVALQLLQIRHQLFGDGVVGLDCGANLGVHTVEWAKALHGRGTVIAIEAQERIYYALAGNIAINNCFNASAIHGAISSEVGTLDIPVPDYLQPSSFGSLELRQSSKSEFIGQAIDPTRTKQVRMLTIDSLNLSRLDFIKIDIEGMELEAIAGGRATIEKLHPVMLIESIKTDKAALELVLDEMGYKTFPLGINVLAVHASDPTLQKINVQA